MRPALVTFGASLALAILALLLAFAGFVSIWKDGLLGMGASLTAIAIAILLLAYPTFLAVKARNLPWIYDITTDPIDPPRYDTLAKARPRDANPIVYPGLAVAEQQLEAYPDIEPLDADIDTRSRLQCGADGHQPAPVAHSRGARPRSGPAGGPHRSGGADADHGLPRRRHRAGSRVRRRRPRRRPLVVALRLVRFRRQCRARSCAARRHRGRVRATRRRTSRRRSRGRRARPRARPRAPQKAPPKAEPKGNQAKR